MSAHSVVVALAATLGALTAGTALAVLAIDLERRHQFRKLRGRL